MHNAKLQLVRKRIGRHTSCLLGHFIYEQSLSLQGHKLDLGCGPVKLPGHIGLDKIDLEPVDIVADLENGHLPFEDESFDVVYSSNTLEHIENINVVMAEVYRILKKNGHFLISVPYCGYIKAFQDTTH
jgi:predicted SAM-dependent methyltransferase